MLNDLRFVDIHYHADPDLYNRKYSAIEAGRRYQLLSGAVVLKSHLGSTAIQASLAQSMGLPVFPSLVLNKCVGGIHYRPILHALSEYQSVYPSRILVHFPTTTGRNHVSKLSRTFRKPENVDFLLSPETLFDDSFRLKKEVLDVLKCARDYPITLSSGHASKDEMYALVDACDNLNVSRLLLNQPANPLTGLSAEELLEMALMQSLIYVEQSSLTYLLGYQSKSDFDSAVNKIPRLIYSSDLGQTSQMDIQEWLDISNSWFNELNLSSERKDEICLKSPLQILNI